MRRVIALLVLAAAPAFAGDVVDRAQIPKKSTAPDGLVRYASTLIPKTAIPLAFQIIPIGSGGGSSAITIGTTTITGGADTQVLFNDAATVGSDAGMTYNKTTDTLTVTNQAGTIFTSAPTFNAGTRLQDNNYHILGTNGTQGFLFRSTFTPAGPTILTGTVSNSYHFMEQADVVYDAENGGCGTSACTDPTFIVHSHNQDADEFIQLSNNGIRGELRSGRTGQAGADLELDTAGFTRAYARAATLAVSDNTATAMFTVTLGDDTDAGGTVSFCSMATSATTDRQKTCGLITFSGVDVTAGAGGEACAAAITGTNSTAVSTGTLTVTGTAATGTDLCTYTITSDSSLNVAHTVRWYLTSFHGSAAAVVVNPQ